MKSVGRQAGLVHYVHSAWAILRKDMTCELRARHAIGAVLLFAITSTIAVSFTSNIWGGEASVTSTLLWLIIYFSAMSGLSRSFVHEDESFTSGTLKLAARPNAVYLGKLIFNWSILIAMEIVCVPLFAVFMNCCVSDWGMLIALLIFGGLALSAGATISAAMVARASVKGALFAVISFPLLIPALALAIHGSSLAIGGQSAISDLRLLIYYTITLITASLMLFRFIWED
ncbi:heme exporter protein CcmB [bacterium]|nr:heme exporter protein CcmB [bacterium]